MPASCAWALKKTREKDHHVTFGVYWSIADEKWLFLFKSINMFCMDSSKFNYHPIVPKFSISSLRNCKCVMDFFVFFFFYCGILV